MTIPEAPERKAPFESSPQTGIGVSCGRGSFSKSASAQSTHIPIRLSPPTLASVSVSLASAKAPSRSWAGLGVGLRLGRQETEKGGGEDERAERGRTRPRSVCSKRDRSRPEDAAHVEPDRTPGPGGQAADGRWSRARRRCSRAAGQRKARREPNGRSRPRAATA